MGNLFRMDLYRMVRAKSFLVCLIIAFVMAVGNAPLLKLVSSLESVLGTGTTTEGKVPEVDGNKLVRAFEDKGFDETSDLSSLNAEEMAEILAEAGIDGDVTMAEENSTVDFLLDNWGGDRSELKEEIKKAKGFPAKKQLSKINDDPFLIINLLLIMLSLCYFFYADVENGYIKNIAGQMPMKGFTILSKFMAAFVHNLIFVAAGIVGNLIGTLFVQRIVADGGVLESIGRLLLKVLLLQSLCAILLLVVSTLRSKALGMILAVLFGLGLTSLIYLGINEALKPLFGKSTNIAPYMPDVVMDDPRDTARAILVALVTGAIFLPLAIRIFDRKDVK